jgi:hypothetical protein
MLIHAKGSRQLGRRVSLCMERSAFPSDARFSRKGEAAA